MNADQAANAKPMIALLQAAEALIDRDVALGLYERPNLRLTVEARKQVAKDLSEQGLSNRQIAKVTGASPKTIDRDLASNDAKSASDDASPAEPDDDGDTTEDAAALAAAAVRGFIYRAREARENATYDDLKDVEITEAMIDAADDAAAAWSMAAQKLRRMST